MRTPVSGVDFVAYDKRDQPVLLALASGSRDTSEVWAARYRRNLLSHRSLPDAPFFLIATPERMYFWRQGASIPDDAPPQFTLDSSAAVKPFFESSEQSPDKISGEGLWWIMLSWLEDLADRGQQRAREDSSLDWLSRSGLLEALRNARIESSAMQ